MKVSLSIQNILIYSELNNKFFFSEFKDKLNVIYGKNTAGKSALIQLILYSFGINDNKIKLAEILSEEIFIRLDCTIGPEGDEIPYTFIRQDETLLIKNADGKVIRFNGIGSDNSAEHIKLKKYFNELFNFTLKLESNSGVSEAPIETIFLPYYVSQDVGWVYLRKSFSNLDFYKNFKEDFLDYYLGIENNVDRELKREIENEIKRLQQQIKFFKNIEKDNQDFEVSKVINDSFSGKATNLIETINSIKAELLKAENHVVNESNKLTFFNQRLAVVSKVKRNHVKQFPGQAQCPTCTQDLPETIEKVYSFYQEENDTVKLQSELKDKIKKAQSKVNSLNKKIESLRSTLKTENNIFTQYATNDVTLESWIDNKANVQLYDNLVKQIGNLEIDLDKEKEKLAKFKTDEEIFLERQKKSAVFRETYLKFNSSLGLPKLEQERFYNIYDISSFPFQGVQLHLAVLSYHFAFNKILNDSHGIQRLPFILDSVFKEDIDGGNKESILNFINANFPKDTQTILSIADDKNTDTKIDDYSSNIFKENAHLICIGEGEREKSLLSPNDNSQDDLIQNTYDILETV